SDGQPVEPGGSVLMTWTVPDTSGGPIFQVGLELGASSGAELTAFLDSVGWTGQPRTVLRRPAGKGSLWRKAWVNAFDHEGLFWPESFRLSQDRGTGLLITGCREWTDYRVSCDISSDMAAEYGIALRVQGLRRMYSLVVKDNRAVELRKELRGRTVLARARISLQEAAACNLVLEARGSRLTGYANGKRLFDVTDRRDPLEGGGLALLCTQGTMATNEVRVEPLEEEKT
ncbi:MAG TPA: ADP-ribosylglycohydrolase family protein, partial [Spirochaetia bacterium]|nr:ADP-ribosylglycohydrolase family protein [Spirochaetia bacterium]